MPPLEAAKTLEVDFPSALAMQNAMVLKCVVSFFLAWVEPAWMRRCARVAEVVEVDWVDVNPLAIVLSVKSAAPFLVS